MEPSQGRSEADSALVVPRPPTASAPGLRPEWYDPYTMPPTHRGMRFGIFLAPFHRVGENPTLALEP